MVENSKSGRFCASGGFLHHLVVYRISLNLPYAPHRTEIERDNLEVAPNPIHRSVAVQTSKFVCG